VTAPAGEPDVTLRDVDDADLDVLFEHQRDPESIAMAAVPARDRAAFLAHWAKARGDETVTAKTIVVGGEVAGHVVSWTNGERREVGYWLGREFWGRGIATRALRGFLASEPVRPLHAHVARHNASSLRVLEKCGFAAAAANDDGIGLVLANAG